MQTTQKRSLSTLCIHGGETVDAQGGIHTPLYNHSTFAFDSTAQLLDVIEGRKEGNLYTRYGMNPTIKAVEKKLALLERGEAALVFGAGMAAASAGFLANCKSGDEIICLGDVYGGTFELLSSQLPELGIKTRFLLTDQPEIELGSVLTERTRMVFLETPSNPNMQITDIAAIARIAKQHSVLLMVDNTFASPINQNPLELGADLVMHSATKYLGGHSDLTGGVIVGAQSLISKIAPWRKNLGQIMAPDVAFVLARSLRTLSVRVRQHNANAQAVAEFLSTHPKVKRVNYPGLPSCAGYETARQQMRGFGGMISFEFDGDAQATAAVVDRLKLFAIAASLGGVESLATQPITTTHHDMSPEERQRRGISDGLVRLSCGLEEAQDLIDDLRQALEN